MSSGLLVHTVTDIKFTIDSAEAANAYERRSMQPVQFLGAWSVDPLGLRLSESASRTMAHTTFYPSYYFTHQPAFMIAENLSKRLHGIMAKGATQ